MLNPARQGPKTPALDPITDLILWRPNVFFETDLLKYVELFTVRLRGNLFKFSSHIIFKTIRWRKKHNQIFGSALLRMRAKIFRNRRCEDWRDKFFDKCITGSDFRLDLFATEHFLRKNLGPFWIRRYFLQSDSWANVFLMFLHYFSDFPEKKKMIRTSDPHCLGWDSAVRTVLSTVSNRTCEE